MGSADNSYCGPFSLLVKYIFDWRGNSVKRGKKPLEVPRVCKTPILFASFPALLIADHSCPICSFKVYLSDVVKMVRYSGGPVSQHSKNLPWRHFTTVEKAGELGCRTEVNRFLEFLWDLKFFFALCHYFTPFANLLLSSCSHNLGIGQVLRMFSTH